MVFFEPGMSDDDNKGLSDDDFADLWTGPEQPNPEDATAFVDNDLDNKEMSDDDFADLWTGPEQPNPEDATSFVDSDLASAQQIANRAFLNHVIRFKINRWSYMKKEWLDMWPGWKDMKGPPLRGSDNPMTLQQLLDPERKPYPRELFFFLLFDFLDNFADDDEDLESLFESKGSTWVREAESWYPGIVVPSSPFEIIPDLYRGLLTESELREQNIKEAPMVYQYLYTQGPGTTADSSVSGFDIEPDTILELASMPGGNIVDLAGEADTMSAGVPDSARDPEQKNLRKQLRRATSSELKKTQVEYEQILLETYKPKADTKPRFDRFVALNPAQQPLINFLQKRDHGEVKPSWRAQLCIPPLGVELNTDEPADIPVISVADIRTTVLQWTNTTKQNLHLIVDDALKLVFRRCVPLSLVDLEVPFRTLHVALTRDSSQLQTAQNQFANFGIALQANRVS